MREIQEDLSESAYIPHPWIRTLTIVKRLVLSILLYRNQIAIKACQMVVSCHLPLQHIWFFQPSVEFFHHYFDTNIWGDFIFPAKDQSTLQQNKSPFTFPMTCDRTNVCQFKGLLTFYWFPILRANYTRPKFSQSWTTHLWTAVSISERIITGIKSIATSESWACMWTRL